MDSKPAVAESAEDGGRTGALESPPPTDSRAAVFVNSTAPSDNPTVQLSRPPVKLPLGAAAWKQESDTDCGSHNQAMDIAPDSLPRPPEPEEAASVKYKMSRMASNLRDNLALLTGNECCQISLSDISNFAAEEAARQGLSQKAIDILVDVIRNGETSE